MSNAANGFAFLTNGGATGNKIAAYDWSRHPLGAIAGWPPVLRTALSMVLNSGFPTYLAWGREFHSFFNDAYLPQLGVKADTALGRPFAELWAEAWDTVGPIAERAFAGESTYFQDLPIVVERHGYPEQTYFTFSYSPVRDECGVVHGVLCTVFESTDKVVALAHSRESEERLELSLEASGNIGTWTYDFENNITVVDDRFARLFQVEPALAGSGTALERFIDAIHPDDRPRVAQAVEQAVASGGAYDAEYRIPRPDGSIGWIAARGKMFIDPRSGKKRFAGVGVDITERKRTEHALGESEAKFRTIADAMPQMVWSTLPDGYHDYYNRQWYEYTGVPEGSTDGEGWNGMFHPDDQPRAWERWRHSLASGDTYEIEYRLRHRSGQYRWVLGRALPVRDDAGNIIRWMGTCTDIHAQKQAEDELKAANRRKDEFLAMLAHELRNPLAPISTAAQLLAMRDIDQQRVRQSSEIIARQVRHMTNLVDDLLDVSRVTRGLAKLDKADTDLKAVVAGAIEQVRPLLTARHHALSVQLPDGAVPVHGDPTRLVQVVTNLLTNAAKYTAPGGQLSLSVTPCQPQVELRVSDNGSGIDGALLPHIFDLFTQGERSSDRSQGGLGLGLALVKSIVALHGGQVEAASAGPGRGSTFTVTLPLQDAFVPAAPAPGNAAPATGHARRLSVMIVDDNADAAHTLGALLETEGHRVVVRTDARGALQSAGGDPPQVFILDIGLPDMDGYALVRRLRAEAATAGALFIALTGYGQQHDRERTAAAGFDHHFVKPVDNQRMRTVLAQVA